jgi:poly(hydroxyalkanoate) granule-associated protein
MAKHNGSAPFADNQLTRLVVESANQVWHVGRGAYIRAGSEGGRIVGGLINIGGRLDREAKSRVYEVRGNAMEALKRLESAFMHRVARTLNALQVPTARDVHELNVRVESLRKAVVLLERRLAEQAASKPAARSRRKPAAGKQRATRKVTARAGGPTGT